MYQTVILGLGFLLIAVGGYFIKITDKQGVIMGAVSNNSSHISVMPTPDEISGSFVCDNTRGCLDNVSLTLTQDGTAQLFTAYNDGEEFLSERGFWVFESGGLMSITLTDSNNKHYDTPHYFLVQSVSTSTLDKISYDTNLYSDFHKPVFVRQVE